MRVWLWSSGHWHSLPRLLMASPSSSNNAQSLTICTSWLTNPLPTVWSRWSSGEVAPAPDLKEDTFASFFLLIFFSWHLDVFIAQPCKEPEWVQRQQTHTHTHTNLHSLKSLICAGYFLADASAERGGGGDVVVNREEVWWSPSTQDCSLFRKIYINRIFSVRKKKTKKQQLSAVQ